MATATAKRAAKSIIIDRELRALIPPLTAEEFSLLEQSICSEGCRDPLVLWRGRNILLDGHHRLGICKTHGIPYPVSKVKLANRDAARTWIIRNQFGRRNLTPYVRCELALKLEPLIRKEAKARQQAGGAKSDGNGRVVRQKSAEPLETRRELAKTAGLSHATIDQAQYIQDHADDEAKATLRRGESSINREFTRAKWAQQQFENDKKGSKQVPRGNYSVVVIDPPWPMEMINLDRSPNQAAMPFPTMTLEDIEALQIPADRNCHIFMWTTQRFMPDALAILKAWKLKYVCAFVWHKPGGFQPFGLPQYNCEFVLYARKGSPKFKTTKGLSTCFNGSRGRHSEKPSAFYEMIQRVTDGPRIDMFSRRKIKGFTGWGNEAVTASRRKAR